MSGNSRGRADEATAKGEPTKPGKGTNAEDPGRAQRRGPRGGRALVEKRVLSAATELFAEKGYSEVTVREIAAQAGVSHALVHRYFGDKIQILAAVLQLNEEWIAARAGSATTLRDAALPMLRDIRRERRDYFKLVARLAMSGLPPELVHPEFPATRRLLEAAEHEAGDMTKDDALLMVRSLVSAVVALAIGWTVLEDLLLPTTGLDEAGEAEAEVALERAVVALIDCYASEWPQQTEQPRAT